MTVWKTGLEHLADLKDNKTEDNKTSELYYSIQEIHDAYGQSKERLKVWCKNGTLKAIPVNTCQTNPNNLKYVVPESELFAKWGKPPRELKYNPASQPDYYIKRWDEQDREKQEAKNRQMQIDFEQTVKLLEPPSKDSLPKAEPVIKSLPAYYNGIKFRSRLEARWAIFFDELGLSWEYEPEGFELENGVRYLPDFLIKDLHGRFTGDLYIEVKGNMANCDWNKLENFAYGDREKDELGNTKIKRPLLVLTDIFHRTSLEDRLYVLRVGVVAGRNRKVCTFSFVDGKDNWECILGVNEEGQGELFTGDGEYSFIYCDFDRTQGAFEKACNAQFDRDGNLLR